ncbi:MULTISPECIES: DUF885 domain-containing protein [unclassified Corynebacterium]|uniref:DUF885 domain-containing protein n=1 Tax=unclassified Corynebacterium TaxID=2624378 RepID=UPI002A90D1BF|nr:DUF885 domain-containing protein [Corynebacterium sp.]MDY5784982.1 DUF885 domain-containing protein [Corynebacterium sp.]
MTLDATGLPEATVTTDADRVPSLLDATCEDYVYDLAEISPTLATKIGVEGYDHELQDFGPEYWDRVADRLRDMVADIDALNDCTDESDDEDDFDNTDHLTAAILRERLTLELDLHHQGEFLRMLNNIDSPVQHIRDAFAMMPKVTPADLDNVESRLNQVRNSLHGYRESLAEAAAQGNVATHRQIDAVINQCEAFAEDESFLERLGFPPEHPAVVEAKDAFEEMADWLSTELSVQADHEDGVGRERYELFSQYFLGTKIDVDEAYDAVLHDLEETVEKQREIAHELFGSDCTVQAAYRRLNEDERYTLHGIDELREWVQETTGAAMDVFARDYFTLPDPVRTLAFDVDKGGSGGVYYTPPSDDFLRPGTIWWSVPEGRDTFHTWQETAHVFHEGVPGHHIQHATALTQRSELNLWRRAVNWNAAHSEGWALYAEHLMTEAGFFDDPALRLGLLSTRRLRLARVAVDLGVHLQKKTPDKSGPWDAQYAKSFLRDNAAMSESGIAFDLDRYMGWPGQAPAYTVGYRAWMQLRYNATAAGMDLREFHDRALRLGSMPMGLLAQELLPN